MLHLIKNHLKSQFVFWKQFSVVLITVSSFGKQYDKQKGLFQTSLMKWGNVNPEDSKKLWFQKKQLDLRGLHTGTYGRAKADGTLFVSMLGWGMSAKHIS